MINAWSLAYDVLNGTLDENFPIKKKPMTDEIKLTGADEGVVNVPKRLEYNDPTHYVDGQGDIHLATSKDDLKVETTSDKKVFNVSYDGLKQEHSDAWYDYTRNDPNRENPFTDPKDRARAERVVSGGNTAANSAEELTISIPPEFNYAASVDHLVNEMPPAFTALSDNDDAIAHHITTPGIEKIVPENIKKMSQSKLLRIIFLPLMVDITLLTIIASRHLILSNL